MNEVKVKIDVWEGRIGETGIVQFQSVDLANMFLRMMNQRVIAEEIRGYLKKRNYVVMDRRERRIFICISI
ncbi:hypothetical protein ACUIJ5_32075 (plasmid) [Bacillus toyonensis]